MGFQYVPSLFRIPKIPSFSVPNGIWRGKGGDEGYFGLYNSSWGGHLIVKDPNFCFKLQFGNSVLTPSFTDVNGYNCWEGDGSVYYSRRYGWVWTTKFPGYEPIENYKWKDEEQEYEWSGDAFYSFSGPPYYPGEEVEMQPRGSLSEKGETAKLKAVWPRWIARNGEFGIYDGADGASGERVKGLPRFRGDGETFVRSLNRENGNYTYGRIHCVLGKWVIGEVGAAGGWHEGSEPKVGGSVNFRFCRPEGSDAEGKDISVSFDAYVCGDETESAFLGSAAIWR